MTDNQNSKRHRLVWLKLLCALLIIGYGVLIYFILQTPDVLPVNLAHSVQNYFLFGFIMVLPLCLLVIGCIMMGRTPHVDRQGKRVGKNGTTLWFRVDLPQDGMRGENHDKQ